MQYLYGLPALVIALSTLYSVQCRNYGHRGSVLGASQYHNHLPAPLMDHHRLPKHFSWCSNGADNLCTPSWNQHIPVYCGSCWAHGSTHMVQDRLKIAKKGMGPDVMLSRQALLNCGAYHGFGDGCNGGDVFDMFGYMTQFGLPDESCMIYTASDHHVFPEGLKQCPDTAFCRNCNSNNESDPGTCWAVKPPVTYKLKHWGRIEPSNVHGKHTSSVSSACLHAHNRTHLWGMQAITSSLHMGLTCRGYAESAHISAPKCISRQLLRLNATLRTILASVLTVPHLRPQQNLHSMSCLSLNLFRC